MAGDIWECDCQRQRDNEEEADDADSGERGKITRGKWAAALGVVAAVSLYVEQVVDYIRCGRAETEGEEGEEFQASLLFAGRGVGWSDENGAAYRNATTAEGRACAAANELDRLIAKEKERLNAV